jgi:hypothetical protein
MHSQTQAWRRTTLVLGSAVILLIAATVPATAAGPTRMADEMILTKAQQDEALRGMGPEERERRSARWADPTVLPVAYSRAYFVLEDDGAGGKTPVEVGRTDGSAKPNFRVPNLDTAATSGSGGRYDLYISVAVVRMSCSGCYQWGIDNWVDWKGTNGMDYANNVEESFGTSWAGDLTLNSDTYAGEYNKCCGTPIKKLDIYRSDATPNEGVGWSFHEIGDPSQCCTKTVNWADGTAHIRETTWKSRSDNVVHKYFHTKGGTAGYSLSFFNAGISITPADSNQWSVAAYATFSH